jgi:hypothetical protein
VRTVASSKCSRPQVYACSMELLTVLQLKVGVVGDRHEFGVARMLDDGVVQSLKIH